MIKNYKESIENENQQFEKTKGRNCGKIRFLIKYYNKEFIYGIVIGVATAFTMFNCYLQFQLILMVEDDSNDSELRISKLLGAFVFFSLVICQLILIAFNLNKYRKTNFLIGHGFMGLIWLAMGISYYFGSFIFAKIAGFLFSACLGLSV